MTLTNLSNPGNIKSFAAKCFPTELVTITEVHSSNVKKITYTEYIQSIRVASGTIRECNYLIDVLDPEAQENDWFYDRAANTLYIYTESASKELIITFGFFFKTGDAEPLHVDLNDTTTDLVLYEGRMKETSFIESIEDISNGTLAISSTTIALINNDGYYQTLARDEVSFRNSYLEVRIFYNTPSNNAVAFTGMIESATFRSKEVIIEAKDLNKKLQSVAKFTDVEAEYITDATTFSGLSSDDTGKEIPYLLGRNPSAAIEKMTTYYDYTVDESGDLIIRSTAKTWDQAGNQHKLIPYSRQSKSVNYYSSDNGAVVYSETVRSRKYIAFRTINSIMSPAKILVTPNMITDLNSELTTVGHYGFEIEITITGDLTNYFVGQQCFLYTGIWDHDGYTADSWPDAFGILMGWHRVSYLNFEYGRIRIAPAVDVKIPKLNSGVKSYLWFTPVSLSYETGSKNIYCSPMSRFVAEETKSNGKLVTIEAARWSWGHGSFPYSYSDTDNKKILAGGICVYRKGEEYPAFDNTTELEEYPFSCRFLTASTNLSLGCILHRTLIEAGYQTDGGTNRVLAVGTNSFRALDTKLGTTYWTLHTGMVDTYLELLQMMLSSVFGFMYVQSDGKIGVRLFEQSPYANKVWEISEDDIVMDSVVSDFNSGGIYTRLKSTSDISKELFSEKTLAVRKLLHGDIMMENQYHFEDKAIYDTKVLPRKYEYLSNSVRKFDFTIINTGYAILLGDRISIDFSQSNKWLGYPKQYDLFVIAIDRSLQGTKITAIENIFPAL